MCWKQGLFQKDVASFSLKEKVERGESERAPVNWEDLESVQQAMTNWQYSELWTGICSETVRSTRRLIDMALSGNNQGKSEKVVLGLL